MRKMKTLFLVILSLFFTLSLSFAQTTGKLAGMVYQGDTKEPLPGANIILENTVLGASSGLDGSFYIINIPPGTYNVIVNMIGYETVKFENLRISVNRTATIDAELNPAIIEGDVIVVQADKISVRKDQTSSMRTISNEQMEALPIENVGAVVSMQAGVVGDHFRGGRSNEVTYMVDGLQVDDAFSGNGRVVEMQAEAIEDLEIVTGTFNAEYGRAMSGVVNQVIKEGSEKLEGSASVGLANYYTSNDDIFIGLKDSEINRNQDYKLSLSGPVYKNKVTFFTNLRYENNKNHLNGYRLFKVNDFSDFSSGNEDEWYSEQNGDRKYVPLNGSKNLSFLGKLTYRITDYLKASVLYNHNDDIWQWYDHQFKYNPDGMASGYRKTNMYSLQLNHMLTKNAFYEAKVSYTDNYNGFYVFKNPLDSAYVHDGYLDGTTPTGFYTGGQQKDHSERFLQDFNAKLDFTWQINHNHSIKIGGLFIDHKLDNQWKEIRNVYFDQGELVDALALIDGKVEYLYYDPVYYTEKSDYADYYKVNPYEFGAYLQDKMEFEDLVMNVGLRFDYFNPNSTYPGDRRKPVVRDQDSENDGQIIDPQKTKPQTQLSPRFGLAYQLGEKANLHFSYGHFFQMPALYALYQNHSYWINDVDYESTVGNVELEAEKTVQYEIGLKQEVMDGIIVDIVVYYRDIYNLLAVKTFSTENAQIYGLYTNKDYGNVKGLEFKVDYFKDNIFANVNYTLQYTRGSANDPLQNFDRAGNNLDPVNRLIPLSWDQRHTFNMTVGYNKSYYGATITGYYNSGAPYTWTPQLISNLYYVNLYPNNDMRPPRYSLDLNAFYKIKILEDLNIVFNLSVYNLLDQKNEVAVDSESGRAYTTVYNDNDILQHHSNFNDYKDRVKNPSMYSSPRMVKLTMSVDF